jgi:hypothetical protein
LTEALSVHCAGISRIDCEGGKERALEIVENTEEKVCLNKRKKEFK